MKETQTNYVILCSNNFIIIILFKLQSMQSCMIDIWFSILHAWKTNRYATILEPMNNTRSFQKSTLLLVSPLSNSPDWKSEPIIHCLESSLGKVVCYFENSHNIFISYALMWFNIYYLYYYFIMIWEAGGLPFLSM